jgi:simple sugar transport system permease protein
VLVQYFDVQPFIASLAGLFLARGLAFVVSLQSIKVKSEGILWLQSTRIRLGDWYVTPTGILAIVVLALGAFTMAYTRFGRTVYAIGGDEQSARLMGLEVARTRVLVYVLSGVCSGLGGLVLTAYSGAGYPRNGIGTELDVIAAVVIGGGSIFGGYGSVLGALAGALVITLMRALLSLQIFIDGRSFVMPQHWVNVWIGVILIVAVLADIWLRQERILQRLWPRADTPIPAKAVAT